MLFYVSLVLSVLIFNLPWIVPEILWVFVILTQQVNFLIAHYFNTFVISSWRTLFWIMHNLLLRLILFMLNMFLYPWSIAHNLQLTFSTIITQFATWSLSYREWIWRRKPTNTSYFYLYFCYLGEIIAHECGNSVGVYRTPSSRAFVKLKTNSESTNDRGFQLVFNATVEGLFYIFI